MSIRNTNELIDALANTSTRRSFSCLTAAVIAGLIFCKNTLAGFPWGILPTPPIRTAGGEIPTGSTIGFPNIKNADVGKTKYMSNLSLFSSVISVFFFYDLLYWVSGFVGNSTASQAITNSPLVNRGDPDGIGNEIYLIGFTEIGNTASNCIVTYINEKDETKTTIPVNAQRLRAGQMLLIPLSEGDLGVKRVVSLQLSASTGTAGNFGIMISRKLAQLNINFTNSGESLDFAKLALPKLDNDVAIICGQLSATTASGNQTGDFVFIEG